MAKPEPDTTMGSPRLHASKLVWYNQDNTDYPLQSLSSLRYQYLLHMRHCSLKDIHDLAHVPIHFILKLSCTAWLGQVYPICDVMAGAEVRLEVLRSLEQEPAARAETIDVAVLLAAMLVQTAFGGEDLPPARRDNWLTHAKERWRESAPCRRGRRSGATARSACRAPPLKGNAFRTVGSTRARDSARSAP